MTLCEHCQIDEATTYITKIVDDNETSEKICNKCVEKIASQITSQTIKDILPSLELNLLDLLGTSSEEAIAFEEAIEHFQKTGKFGHPDDYRVLKEQVKGMLNKIHGSTQHCGKVPQNRRTPKQEIDELTVLMNDAALLEQFEDAAELRDRIQKLQQ